MKFFLNYIFIAVFLLSSVGFDIITHYCCNESSATLNAPADECHSDAKDCCSDDCCHDGCTTTITHIQLNDFNTNTAQINTDAQFECQGKVQQDDFDYSAKNFSAIPFYLITHHGQKTYLDNLNLRI